MSKIRGPRLHNFVERFKDVFNWNLPASQSCSLLHHAKFLLVVSGIHEIASQSFSGEQCKF